LLFGELFNVSLKQASIPIFTDESFKKDAQKSRQRISPTVIRLALSRAYILYKAPIRVKKEQHIHDKESKLMEIPKQLKLYMTNRCARRCENHKHDKQHSMSSRASKRCKVDLPRLQLQSSDIDFNREKVGIVSIRMNNHEKEQRVCSRLVKVDIVIKGNDFVEPRRPRKAYQVSTDWYQKHSHIKRHDETSSS
jgi:hypothetical protein